MGVKDVLSRKEGVIVGDDVLGESPQRLERLSPTDSFAALFKYAQEKNFAIPAIVRCSSLSLLERTTNRLNRMLPHPQPWSQRSRLLVTRSLQLSCRLLREAQLTLLARYVG